MQIKPILTLCLALVLPLAAVASEHGPHDKAIKARQAVMQLYSFNLGILGAMAKGKIDYDADSASTAAANLLTLISIDQSAKWPQGSDNENFENAENRALPAIWSSFPEVAEAGKVWSDAAVALNDAAGSGLDALKDAMGAAGKSCKGCHDDFRAEKE